MNIHSAANIETIRHFMSGPEGVTHFHLNDDGTADAWRMQTCDHCGAECRGVNAIRFLSVPLPGLLVIARLEPSDVVDELGANDDGDAVCPGCYASTAAEEA